MACQQAVSPVLGCSGANMALSGRDGATQKVLTVGIR